MERQRSAAEAPAAAVAPAAAGGVLLVAFCAPLVRERSCGLACVVVVVGGPLRAVTGVCANLVLSR